MSEDAATRLPDVARVPLSAPFGWLVEGWRDFMSTRLPCLFYGLILAAISAAIAWGLYFSGAFDWVLILAGGFLLIGPMVAMGLYEAARQLELGQQPRLRDMLFVKGAVRGDLFYLGVALFLVYLFWSHAAQLVYGLSTYRMHKTPNEFLTFLFTDPDGQRMGVIGTAIGGTIAFFAYMLVVVAAPMLLDKRYDVFVAVVTSVRAVLVNPWPLLLWAFLIVLIMALGTLTAFLGLIIAFPVIGLASWHAYRELVPNA